MTKNDIFEPALAELKGDIDKFGPVSFTEYLKKNHLAKQNTARSISIDFYESLKKSLREKDAMVLRLGKSIDNQTAL